MWNEGDSRFLLILKIIRNLSLLSTDHFAFLPQQMFVLSQSCPTLCNPLDCSPSGSSVHETLQVRILKWVAMPSSRGSSQPRDQTCISYVSSPALAGGFFTASVTWRKYIKSSLLKGSGQFIWGFPGGGSGLKKNKTNKQKKKTAFQCRRCKSCGFNLWVKKIPWRRAWQPT